MARDIEEFLRRAAERRQQQKQGGAAPVPQTPPQAQPQQTPPPVAQSPILDKTPRNQFRKFPTTEPIIENVEIVEDRSDARRKSEKRETVAEHVEKYLDNSDIKQKTKSLGSQVSKVGQEFDRAVKQHLNKDICSVDEGRTSTEPQKKINDVTAASKLKEMLARPETISQAILISEILNRPSFEDD